MLIYNYKKEFLGIDESDLSIFSLKNLAELRNQSADFADLFVKTPGCIHNFKHVHWIDYILNGDGAEAKVIIHIKNQNYSAVLSIGQIYLIDNPTEAAYSVSLNNIKTLLASQSEELIQDLNERTAPQTATGNTELLTAAGSIVHDKDSYKLEEKVSFDPYEAPKKTQIIEDVYETPEIKIEDLTADDAPLDIELEVQATPKKEPETFTQPQVIEQEEIIENEEFKAYVYDPKVASEELGLPIDLIEEFIQDFISQAHSFKTELYTSMQTTDIDNLKVQSHKLKGVAANLRIEDALNALSIINTSQDNNEIKTNLDRFYIMIDKLSGKIATPKKQEDTDNKDDDFILSFKDDNPAIVDSDVPKNINRVELADDDFLNLQEDTSQTEDEDLTILDNLDKDIEIQSTPKAEKIPTETFSYNKKAIANDIGLDIDSFNELFSDYIIESKELADTIMQSAENNDLVICKNLSHKLKGMSENMRINNIIKELKEIIETDNIENIKKLINIVLSKLNQLATHED